MESNKDVGPVMSHNFCTQIYSFVTVLSHPNNSNRNGNNMFCDKVTKFLNFFYKKIKNNFNNNIYKKLYIYSHTNNHIKIPLKY